VSRRSAKGYPLKDTTLDRLRSAAGRVLAQSGLRGATTRKIAAEAGVSEMTLFRRFGTKERLLSAVIDRLLLEETSPPRVTPVSIERNDLRGQLLECAKTQANFINRNLPLIRVFVGEPKHFGEEERNVLRELFAPMRKEIRRILARELLDAGEVDLVVHLLSAIIFVHVLRISRAERTPYSATQYLATAVDMVLAFLNERKAGKQSLRRRTTLRRKVGFRRDVVRKQMVAQTRK
jgi:AcrR family transcriptional regulator